MNDTRHTTFGDPFGSLLNRLYGAAEDPSALPDALARLSDLCRLENAAFVVNDPALGLARVVSPRADPEVIADYDRTWWRYDPTVAATSGRPVGEITSLETTGRELFLNSRFHNEYWRHSGLGAERLASNLATGDGAFAAIVVQTGTRRDEIDSHAHRMFAAVVPHAVRATAIMRRLQALELARKAGEETARHGASLALPVDAALRPIVADDATEAALSALPGIRLAHGRLTLDDAAETARLQRLVAGCAAGTGGKGAPRGGTMTIGAAEPGTGLMLEALPWRGADHPAALLARPVALLLITDRAARKAARLALMQERFGLTGAEARLCAELLAGGNRREVAARLGISDATARTHLSRIFQKTGVNRQSELISRLLGY